MKQSLHRRLEQLEAVSASLQTATRAEAARASVLDKVQLFLRMVGIEKTPEESLAEAWARGLDISATELRSLLAARIDPIRKYWEDRGIKQESRRSLCPAAEG